MNVFCACLFEEGVGWYIILQYNDDRYDEGTLLYSSLFRAL